MPQFLGGSFLKDEIIIMGKHLEKSEQMCSIGAVYTLKSTVFSKIQAELSYNPELPVLNINSNEMKSKPEKNLVCRVDCIMFYVSCI